MNIRRAPVLPAPNWGRSIPHMPTFEGVDRLELAALELAALELAALAYAK